MALINIIHLPRVVITSPTPSITASLVLLLDLESWSLTITYVKEPTIAPAVAPIVAAFVLFSSSLRTLEVVMVVVVVVVVVVGVAAMLSFWQCTSSDLVQTKEHRFR